MGQALRTLGTDLPILLLPGLPLAALLRTSEFRGGALLAESATLATTGVLAVLTAATALVLAVPIAPWMASRPVGAARIAWLATGGALLALAAVPPVLAGGVVSALTGLGPAPEPGTLPVTLRVLGLAFAWGLGAAPLVAATTALQLRAVPAAEAGLAATLVPPAEARRWIGRGRRRTPRLAAAAFGSLVALTDATTPPHFGVETLASRIHARWMTTLDAGDAAGALAFLWILAAAALVAPLRFLSGSVASRGRAGVATARSEGPAAAALTAIVFGGIASWCLHRATPPLGGGLDRLLEPAARSATDAWVAGGVAAACGVGGLALAAATAARAPGSPPNFARCAALALALAPPGLGLALGAGSLLGSEADPDSWAFIPLLLRTAPAGALALVLLGPSSVPVRAAALGLPPAASIRLTLGAGAARPALLAGFLGAALALRETEIWSAWPRPGEEPLALRFAQLLHYGFRPEVAEAGLALLAASWAIGSITLCLLSMGPRDPGSVVA